MGIILFFDDWKILSRTGMERKQGNPCMEEDSVFEDEKTEGAWNYPVVWKDTEKNKWLAIYGQALPFAYDEKAGFCIKTVEFYRLVSSDGIHWKRSSRTPVFSREDGDIEAARIDGGPIYYDLQESDESKKLKLLYRLFDANGTPQERIAYSQDGKVWTTEILKGKNIFHSPASIFYNREEKKYYISNWFHVHDRRIAFYATKDFKKVEDPIYVLQSDGEDDCAAETYALLVFPYENIYIGLLWMFHGDTKEIKVNRLKGYMDCQLVYSYNGKNFQRVFHKPFIARNSRGKHAGGSVFPTSIVVNDDEIFIYASGSKGEMFKYQEECDAALFRYNMRKDGFAYLTSYTTGEVCTKAVKFYGDKFDLNICAPYGVVKLQILNEDGKIIEGMSYEECTCKSIDSVEWSPTWNGGKTIADIKNQVVFIEIEISNGEIYAIRGDFDVLGANYIKLE